MKTDLELIRLMAMTFQTIISFDELVVIPIETAEGYLLNQKGNGLLFCESGDEGFHFAVFKRDHASFQRVKEFRREPNFDPGNILLKHPFLEAPLEAQLGEITEPVHFSTLLEIADLSERMLGTCLTFMKSPSPTGARRLVVFATNRNESSLTSFSPWGETKYIHDFTPEQHEHVLQMFREMKFESTASNTKT